jgi:hypothetical protein
VAQKNVIPAVAMERILQRNLDVDRWWRRPAVEDRTSENLHAQHGITKHGEYDARHRPDLLYLMKLVRQVSGVLPIGTLRPISLLVKCKMQGRGWWLKAAAAAGEQRRQMFSKLEDFRGFGFYGFTAKKG